MSQICLRDGGETPTRGATRPPSSNHPASNWYHSISIDRQAQWAMIRQPNCVIS